MEVVKTGNWSLIASSSIIAACCTGCLQSGPFVKAPYQPYFVYVANNGSNTVSEFVADQNGVLSFIDKVPTGSGPIDIATDNYRVYVANEGDSSISVYQIEAGGALVPLGKVATPAPPGSIAVATFSASLNGANSLAVSLIGNKQVAFYSIELSPNFVFADRPIGMPVFDRTLPAGLGPLGAGGDDYYRLAVANYGDNTMTVYRRGLTIDTIPHPWHVDTAFEVSVGSGPIQVRTNYDYYHTHGNLSIDDYYVLNQNSSNISMFRDDQGPIDNTGSGKYRRRGAAANTHTYQPMAITSVPDVVTYLGTSPTGSHPVAETITRRDDQSDFNRIDEGQMLYTANAGSLTISAFTIQPDATLKLQAGPQPATGPTPTSLVAQKAYSNDNPIVYVTDSDGMVRCYTQTQNALVPLQTIDSQGTGSVALCVTSKIGTPFSNVPFKIDTILPNGIIGVPYNQLLRAVANGKQVPQVYFEVTAGNLPPGLQIGQYQDSSSETAIEGTPTTLGTFTFTLHAISENINATKSYTVVIGGKQPLTIVNTSFPNGVLGTLYVSPAFQLNGGDGSQTASWKVAAGALPLGMFLTDLQAEVSGNFLGGTPAKVGTSTFTLEATQNAGSAEKQFTLTVTATNGILTISNTSLSTGWVGTTYATPLTLTGGNGTQTATWAVTSGALPPGLKLVIGPTEESISGTPSGSATYSFTLEATQGASTATKALSILVKPTPVMTVQFLNAATAAIDQSLFLDLNSAAIKTQFGTTSPAQQWIYPGSNPYLFYNATGQNWPSGNITLSALNRNVIVALDLNDGTHSLQNMFLVPSFPAATNAGFSFMNGLDPHTATAVDVILYNNVGTAASATNIGFGAFTTLQAPPGTYILRVNLAGSQQIITTSAPVTVAAGKDMINIAVSSPSTSSVVQVLEAP